MLNAMIFASTPWLATRVRQWCAEIRDITVQRHSDGFPSHGDLAQALNAFTPRILFIEVTSPEAFRTLELEARGFLPDVAILGITERLPNAPILSTLGSALRVLSPAASAAEVWAAISQALDTGQGGRKGGIWAFLPAKAGSGATTAALNTAGLLAEEWKQKTLVLEADWHSASLSILLNLNADRSIIQALEASAILDDRRWQSALHQLGNLDVLMGPTGPLLGPVDRWDVHRMLAFLRPRYDAVVCDLPEVVNDATELIVRQARRVHVVCTPELPSLHMVNRRIRALEDRGVPAANIGVVLNRHLKSVVERDVVEKFLNRKLDAILPNDYSSVQQAVLEQRLVLRDTELGRAYASLVGQWTGTSSPRPSGRTIFAPHFSLKRLLTRQAHA